MVILSEAKDRSPFKILYTQNHQKRASPHERASMTRIRPELTAVPESPLVQIATLAESMPGSIKLCYGESDMPTPSFITEAAHRAALAGHTSYTHTAGFQALRQAIGTKVRQLHGAEYG